MWQDFMESLCYYNLNLSIHWLKKKPTFYLNEASDNFSWLKKLLAVFRDGWKIDFVSEGEFWHFWTCFHSQLEQDKNKNLWGKNTLK